MWWNSALTVMQVLRLRRQKPRTPHIAWQNFWNSVTATGDGGDVLWDASDAAEATRYRDILVANADLHLPLVDLACGNGRFTRTLAPAFPRTVGVDVAPAAVALAQVETAAGEELSGTTFRALDMTEPGAGSLLHDDLGTDVNVFVRGLLHILTVAERQNLVGNIAALVGTRGVVLIAETNHRGSRIAYLERLGAGPRALPHALAKVIISGVPEPSSFGEAELAECFPAGRWNRALVDPTAVITTVPTDPSTPGNDLPGFVALLAPRGSLVPHGR